MKTNEKLRQYVRENISPTVQERQFISKIYESLEVVLNDKNIIQIGSYPRFTSIRPLHDLDILCIMGEWSSNSHNPSLILEQLENRINKDFGKENPTEYSISTSLQTHSVSISFTDGVEEKFSVDIVPAYIFEKNEFRQDTYKVPEILIYKHGEKRLVRYNDIKKLGREMNWLTSDPLGYIEVAKRTNKQNEDFRKVVKFTKRWKVVNNEVNENFKLKSFHAEQIVTEIFKDNGNINIFEAIQKFFEVLESYLQKPQIRDRADKGQYIDNYVSELSGQQKQLILKARDAILRKLNVFLENSSVEELLDPELSDGPIIEKKSNSLNTFVKPYYNE